MKARTYVLTRRWVRWGGLLLVAGAGIWVGANVMRQYCPAGSMITNPDGFASANVAAGLRSANR